jgi:hypothetical protein
MMNRKLIIGVIFLAVGIFLIYFGLHSIQKASDAKGFSENFKNFFSHNPMWNPVIKPFGGTPQQKIPEHHITAWICLIGGAILVIGGAVSLIFYRKKR